MIRNPKIIFRADGGPAIGMGHFSRSLALAEILREDFFCVFATQRPTAWQIGEIKAACDDIISLPEATSHFDCFLAQLEGCETVVLDNYYFGTDFQRAIKDKGCQVVCIDDIHDRHFVADMVINHAEGIDPGVYSIEPGARLLLGHEYALLRKGFFQTTSKAEPKAYSVLVIMGGADPGNLTSRLALLLSDLGTELPVAVVVGSAYQGGDHVAVGKKVEVFRELSPEKIQWLMRRSTVGLLPASTVAIEACASRLPFVVGHFVDNQREACAGLVTRRLALPGGDFCSDDICSLLEAVRELCTSEEKREGIIRSQREHLDRRSPDRLRMAFQALCQKRRQCCS